MIISFIVYFLMILVLGCMFMLYSSRIGMHLWLHYLLISWSYSHKFFCYLSSLSIICLLLPGMGITFRSTYIVIRNALWSEYGVRYVSILLTCIHFWSPHFHNMISLFAYRLPLDHEKFLSWYCYHPCIYIYF